MIMPKKVRLLAGTDRPVGEAMEPFAPQALDFLDALSRALCTCSTDPETVAFAFWCRRAHLRSLQKKHGIATANDMRSSRSLPEGQKIEVAALRLGRGRIFHLAPANVPMMFAYTWAIGLLAGNAGIVRISERTLRLESVQLVLETLQSLFGREQKVLFACEDGCDPARNESSASPSPFAEIRIRSSFITYEHSNEVTEEILSHCDGRVLWGGDETIRRMRQIPMPAHAVELAFPDRVSLAVIDEKVLAQMPEEDLRSLVHRFYNDTYVMDQNGCSSPQTVIWLQEQQTECTKARLRQTECAEEPETHRGAEPGEEFHAEYSEQSIREKWWNLLAQEAETEYENDGFRAARKLEKSVLASMSGGEAGKPAVTTIRRFGGNALYVLHLEQLPENLANYKGGFGLFYEAETDSPKNIFGSFFDRIQTIVCIGIRPNRLAASALQAHSPGVLRFVEAGQALQMDTFWDGMDLIEALSRRILL